MNLPESIRTDHQTQKFLVEVPEGLRGQYQASLIELSMRHDDCGNKRNNFAMIATGYKSQKRRANDDCAWTGIAEHTVVDKFFPQFSHMVKWHLTFTDGPMHYIPNTKYYAGLAVLVSDKEEKRKACLDHAREAAVWLDATDEDLRLEGLEERLVARLPSLMNEFKRDIEALGFTY